jgi:hypothetical protein
MKKEKNVNVRASSQDCKVQNNNVDQLKQALVT